MAKRTTSWVDHLSSSQTPDDEMNFQTGNNFGLDAFQFDVPDNQGPEDGGRLPSTRGLSGLPDGTIPAVNPELSFQSITDDSDSGLGMNFTAMLSVEEGGLPKDASIIDLQWLDPTQIQDQDRLPNNYKTLNSVPELEKAWGNNKSTDGTKLVPNRDREAANYEASLSKSGNVNKKTAKEVDFFVRRALRRAHYGDPVNKIQAELFESMGNESPRVAYAMDVIREEHGLLGKVFIRASAFPGVKNGKWLDAIKTKAGGARYVITDDQAVADKLGMKMVSEVPWSKALSYYSSRLQAAGYKVASSGNPKEDLRRAFRVGPSTQQAMDAIKPVEVRHEASREEAELAIKAPRVAGPTILTPDELSIASKRRSALVQIARWVKEGKLAQPDAIRIHASGAPADDMLRTASSIITAFSNSATYSGEGTRASKEAQLLRARALESLESKAAAVEGWMMDRAKSGLLKAVKSGTLTVDEAKRVSSMSKNASELSMNTAAAVQASASIRRNVTAKSTTVDYAGHIQKAAVHMKVGDAPTFDEYTQRIISASNDSGIKVGEITNYLKWARQKMADGEMGSEFTSLLKARFSLPLRKAAKSLLKEIRSTHEGLSGHLYVDAGAYASNTGTTGCESGALKHRSNSIKYVLSMQRCNGCTFVNANGTCSQYNKKLASSPPVDNVKEYQDEVLRLANSSEPEVVASMFNPNEFGLTSDHLDNVHASSGQRVKELGDVLFGGMEV